MLGVFRIHEPDTVEDASRLLADYGDEAAVYAGGTELLVLMKEGLVHYSHLVDIKTISGLDAVDVGDVGSNGAPDGGTLTIGPLVTHRRLAHSPIVRAHAPLLGEMARRVANVRVRAVGTIGGNLCFAEPHSDPATLLLAWEATLELSSTSGCREVPAAAFFVGVLETARRPDEVLTAIRLPILALSIGGSYQKVSTHERPTASVAALVQVRDGVIERARLAVGSVGPLPVRVPEAEEALVGASPVAAAFEAAGATAARAVSADDDLYGSAEYKRHLVRVLTADALAAAAARVRTGEGDGQ